MLAALESIGPSVICYPAIPPSFGLLLLFIMMCLRYDSATMLCWGYVRVHRSVPGVCSEYSAEPMMDRMNGQNPEKAQAWLMIVSGTQNSQSHNNHTRYAMYATCIQDLLKNTSGISLYFCQAFQSPAAIWEL